MHETESVIFRPAASETELEGLLRLRYRVFDDGGLGAFLARNIHEIDLDSHDLNSHHVGLFRGDTPIGYARLVTPDRGRHSQWVQRIVRRYGRPEGRSSARPIELLPAMEYAPDIAQTREWAFRQIREGRGVMEPSRLSLVPEHRSIRLGRFMAQALASYGRVVGIDAAVLTCGPSHARMWESLGFRPGPGTREFAYHGVVRRVLVVTRDWLAPNMQSAAIEMTREFNRSGWITVPARRTSDLRPISKCIREGWSHADLATVAS